MFIFDRCCRSSAAVTPVQYKCDTNNLTDTFARSHILLTEKLMNGALVTPTPDKKGGNMDKIDCWARIYVSVMLRGRTIVNSLLWVRSKGRRIYRKKTSCWFCFAWIWSSIYLFVFFTIGEAASSSYVTKDYMGPHTPDKNPKREPYHNICRSHIQNRIWTCFYHS